MNTRRIKTIEQRLSVLGPTLCQVTDESHHHIGHAGAASGAGHFHVKIISQKFCDLKLIERHRLVYDVLGDLMQTEIHALSIMALTPQEVT